MKNKSFSSKIWTCRFLNLKRNVAILIVSVLWIIVALACGLDEKVAGLFYCTIFSDSVWGPFFHYLAIELFIPIFSISGLLFILQFYSKTYLHTIQSLQINKKRIDDIVWPSFRDMKIALVLVQVFYCLLLLLIARSFTGRIFLLFTIFLSNGLFMGLNIWKLEKYMRNNANGLEEFMKIDMDKLFKENTEKQKLFDEAKEKIEQNTPIILREDSDKTPLVFEELHSFLDRLIHHSVAQWDIKSSYEFVEKYIDALTNDPKQHTPTTRDYALYRLRNYLHDMLTKKTVDNCHTFVSMKNYMAGYVYILVHAYNKKCDVTIADLDNFFGSRVSEEGYSHVRDAELNLVLLLKQSDLDSDKINKYTKAVWLFINYSGERSHALDSQAEQINIQPENPTREDCTALLEVLKLILPSLSNANVHMHHGVKSRRYSYI